MLPSNKAYTLIITQLPDKLREANLLIGLTHNSIGELCDTGRKEIFYGNNQHKK